MTGMYQFDNDGGSVFRPEQGTFPFTATELLSPDGLKGRVRHTAHHDLESFFWILWVTSVN